MARRRKQLMDQIRDAVDISGLSRYRLSKELGVPGSSMSKFMSGQTGLSAENLDALCDFLGLDLVQRHKRRAPKGR